MIVSGLRPAPWRWHRRVGGVACLCCQPKGGGETQARAVCLQAAVCLHAGVAHHSHSESCAERELSARSSRVLCRAHSSLSTAPRVGMIRLLLFWSPTGCAHVSQTFETCASYWLSPVNPSLSKREEGERVSAACALLYPTSSRRLSGCVPAGPFRSCCGVRCVEYKGSWVWSIEWCGYVCVGVVVVWLESSLPSWLCSPGVSGTLSGSSSRCITPHCVASCRALCAHTSPPTSLRSRQLYPCLFAQLGVSRVTLVCVEEHRRACCVRVHGTFLGGR
jgi:hypothetical protein